MNINQEITKAKYRLETLEQQLNEFHDFFSPKDHEIPADWHYDSNQVDEWRLPNVSKHELRDWLINLSYGVRSNSVTADELIHKLHSLPTGVHDYLMRLASFEGGHCFENMFRDRLPVKETTANQSNFEIAPKETEFQTNWYYAKLYCAALNIDGKTGWRMPTKEELNQIYKSEHDFEKEDYWSSTEAIGESGHGDYAWYLYFGPYPVPNFYKKDCDYRYIRAIRDLP